MDAAVIGSPLQWENMACVAENCCQLLPLPDKQK
jgi:hypothetical protein